MLSKEPLVRGDSEYYLFMPSAVAPQIYLYPVCIGRFFYQAGYHLVRKQYDSFLLMYVSSGKCVFSNGDPQPAPPVHTAIRDQVVLLDCYAPHTYSFPEDSEILWLHFDGPLARSYYDLLMKAGGPVFTIENLYPVTHNMQRIMEGFQKSQPPREDAISFRITQMLDALLLNDRQSGTSMVRSQPIEAALTFISEHFAEPLTLEQIAGRSNLSPYYFTRIFTSETGMTPHQYLIAIRLNSAKYLLRTNSMSIKEIAFASGFNSESSFCATFRKREKLTPSEYRAKTFI